MNPQAQPQLDELDVKLAQAFPGRVVRKDLVKRLKVGSSVPVYVLESARQVLFWHESGSDSDRTHASERDHRRADRSRDQAELVKARLQTPRIAEAD